MGSEHCSLFRPPATACLFVFFHLRKKRLARVIFFVFSSYPKLFQKAHRPRRVPILFVVVADQAETRRRLKSFSRVPLARATSSRWHHPRRRAPMELSIPTSQWPLPCLRLHWGDARSVSGKKLPACIYCVTLCMYGVVSCVCKLGKRDKCEVKIYRGVLGSCFEKKV